MIWQHALLSQLFHNFNNKKKNSSVYVSVKWQIAFLNWRLWKYIVFTTLTKNYVYCADGASFITVKFILCYFIAWQLKCTLYTQLTTIIIQKSIIPTIHWDHKKATIKHNFFVDRSNLTMFCCKIFMFQKESDLNQSAGCCGWFFMFDTAFGAFNVYLKEFTSG